MLKQYYYINMHSIVNFEVLRIYRKEEVLNCPFNVEIYVHLFSASV